MKQVLIQGGNILVEDVPAPVVEVGHILVQVESSCISAGTELSGIRASAVPLWKKALKQPQKIKKVLDVALTEGLSKATNLVEKTKAWQPVGYSAAGKVIAVGPDVLNFKVGDIVACAGAQCAFHAEIISVPVNLSVKVPDRVTVAHASTVTLGAIAMQGVRRLNPTLGETFAVVGLGILGQLTVQMLKANGCRVVAIDLDRTRVDLAIKSGADFCVDPVSEDDIEKVFRISDGHGLDGVIVTAATHSHEVISSAFKMCRKKGRVVLVGDVGLNINRNDIYMKELDFFVSTSYGPGRYDTKYEEEGLDYPISHVRWTENRNLSEYLRLVSDNLVRLNDLIQSEFPLERATEAYEAVKSTTSKPLIVLLKYEGDSEVKQSRVVENKSPRMDGTNIKVGVIGAGGFAQYAHLPNLKEIPSFDLAAVVTRNGHKAVAVAKQFGARYATTDYTEVLRDKDVNMVIVSTRHDSHMSLALEALANGKNVLLEKPLCISENELNQIKEFFASQRNPPVLMTGFNRRFSPFAKKIKEILRNRTSPLIINYRMNAGFIPLDNWVHGKEGGGRNIGEACHIYDLFTFFTEARVKNVNVNSIGTGFSYSISDNFVASFTFEDGSVATLTYTAMGHNSYAKEHMELFCEGKVIVMEDFKTLEVHGSTSLNLKASQDKGQKEELIAFAAALKNGEAWPIPLWQQVQATEMSFAVEKMIRKR
ncbi:bi-domain-containing oxidoreductase [Bdellovibrio bacteriovorus]|uniref:bi-domain-containing oxidoreductase n=1 Tax=Bdellovibrio bacteriovorus TaxID=959 RepID=UPI0035A6FDA6